MSCTNCFSGCVSTTSDKCVKYTGNSIGFLGVSTGDTLESVEKAITDYLATIFNGVGIFPTIEPSHICEIVSNYFPCAECGDPTLVDILTAIIRAICQINDELEIERARIDVIEADYDTSCLSAEPAPGTHATLQAVITELCTAIADINTLNNLFQTCITTATINSYIAAYINSVTTTNLMYTKMVPYVVYPFYPSATYMTGAFDVTGAGIGIWQKVYLCNGYNGLTPDLRGRSIIGTTDMGGGSFDPEVDPGLGNPSYNLGDTGGVNSIILSGSQVAAHTHLATAEVTDPGHSTTIDTWATSSDVQHSGLPNANYFYPICKIGTAVSTNPQSALEGPYNGVTSGLDETGVSVAVSVAENTGGQAHDNIHPVLACYYIMYVPS